MLTPKAIVLALLAACRTTANPTEKDNIFGCANIDNKTVLLPEAHWWHATRYFL